MNPSIPLLNDTLKHFRKLFGGSLNEHAHVRFWCDLIFTYWTSLNSLNFYKHTHTPQCIMFFPMCMCVWVSEKDFLLRFFSFYFDFYKNDGVDEDAICLVILLLLLLLFHVIFHLNGIFVFLSLVSFFFFFFFDRLSANSNPLCTIPHNNISVCASLVILKNLMYVMFCLLNQSYSIRLGSLIRCYWLLLLLFFLTLVVQWMPYCSDSVAIFFFEDLFGWINNNLFLFFSSFFNVCVCSNALRWINHNIRS